MDIVVCEMRQSALVFRGHEKAVILAIRITALFLSRRRAVVAGKPGPQGLVLVGVDPSDVTSPEA
jgi:hypothetical protein